MEDFNKTSMEEKELKKEDMVDEGTELLKLAREKLPQNVINFLNEVAQKLVLNEGQKQLLVEESIKFSMAMEQEEKEAQERNQVIVKRQIKDYFGDNYEQSIVFIKRGLNWLGLKKVESSREISFEIIVKLAELGKLVSEDGSVGEGGENFTLTKQEAIKMREAITQNKDFSNIMFNKMHPSRKKIMDKLHYLNGIIGEK